MEDRHTIHIVSLSVATPLSLLLPCACASDRDCDCDCDCDSMSSDDEEWRDHSGHCPPTDTTASLSRLSRLSWCGFRAADSGRDPVDASNTIDGSEATSRLVVWACWLLLSSVGTTALLSRCWFRAVTRRMVACRIRNSWMLSIGMSRASRCGLTEE